MGRDRLRSLDRFHGDAGKPAALTCRAVVMLGHKVRALVRTVAVKEIGELVVGTAWRAVLCPVAREVRGHYEPAEEGW